MTQAVNQANVSKIQRALISVSDKDGVLALAEFLVANGVEILSTGGTAKLLQSHNVEVSEVSGYTGFPEMMDGRVKTLHPKVHGGILGRRDIDLPIMRDNGILPIDLVVVNLYPFENTVANKDCAFDDAIENIDIGGPTMIRAAAKNFKDVTVIVETSDYAKVISEITEFGGTQLATRKAMATKVFNHMARYDSAISNYLNNVDGDIPAVVNSQVVMQQSLRYGENPHQNAAFYRHNYTVKGSIASAVLHQGKALSFNNIADADAAWQCVNAFEERACVIVKHANPCGVAIGKDNLDAYQKAYQSDPSSAFGGIIAFNHALDAVSAKAIIDQQFVEVIIAPSIDADALVVLKAKDNVRVLDTQGLLEAQENQKEMKNVSGGMLIQDTDNAVVTKKDISVATKEEPDAAQMDDLLFAWKVVKFTKSNAIVYVKNKQTIGIGAGQMSRVYSAKIAAIKAEEEGFNTQGAVMASDAFFPFRDTVDNAHAIGISAIIQPGGSMRDDEVIAAADENNMAMVFTGVRHFKH